MNHFGNTSIWDQSYNGYFSSTSESKFIAINQLISMDTLTNELETHTFKLELIIY